MRDDLIVGSASCLWLWTDKLTDPAYAGFFLKFKPNATYHVPNCDDNYSPSLCSEFYHDQEQTPEVTTVVRHLQPTPPSRPALKRRRLCPAF